MRIRGLTDNYSPRRIASICPCPLAGGRELLSNVTFLVGTGRCGSTALQHHLAQHPRVGWLSNVLTVAPGWTSLNRYILKLDARVPIPRITKGRIHPSECYPFWDQHVPGFSEPYRDLLSTDVTKRQAATLRRIVDEVTVPSRPNLLIKLTGWPRVGFLAEVFPEARFIHLLRDGRAVANSLINVSFWSGWLGPTRWRWGNLTADQASRWKAAGESFVALAGIEWEILVGAHDRALEQLPEDRVLEVRYEKLTAQPKMEIERILQFMRLGSRRGTLPAPEEAFQSSNTRWRDDLAPRQKEVLERCIADALQHHGYELVL